MDSSRWDVFPKNQQLLSIGSELMRAKVWQNQDTDKFKLALERGLELIDLCLADPKWKDNAYALLERRF